MITLFPFCRISIHKADGQLCDIFLVEYHSRNSVNYLKSFIELYSVRKFGGYKNVLHDRHVCAIPT